ncbi:leucyl/phenylalanyl-tRNA--protein transferase [Lapillicoccus sp.]|uniref:leucyl/phenylalanyl-tRNA--protein transferase n=1 Tax=Lapillicoccus sp. TaxID=1909287 RepID=UPI0032678867
MPTLPPRSRYTFAVAGTEQGEDLVGVGADLAPGTILEAYVAGVFPMGLGDYGGEPLGWWSPDPRGVLLPANLHVSRSMHRAMHRFEIRVDSDFAGVVAGCADPGRAGRWITPEITRAYSELHRLGWAHSVEVVQDGALVGGLYGLAVGGLFAGESMFHRATDASKAAVIALHDLVTRDGDPRRIIDVQWRTDHLASLGVTELSRAAYLRRLASALQAPLPEAFA